MVTAPKINLHCRNNWGVRSESIQKYNINVINSEHNYVKHSEKTYVQLKLGYSMEKWRK